jgi:indole-3-glycerol phosphate synthase
VILDEIVAHKKEEVAARKARLGPRDAASRAVDAPPAPDFARALEAPGLSVIAEIKGASPSAGTIRDGFDPVVVARAYEAGGAAALSVLTDARYFGGSWESLGRVCSASALPVLCKEFVVDAYQIDEARSAGAAAVLLIAALLDGAQLRDFLGRAGDRGLAAVVEVHTPDEAAVAVDTGAGIVGINNRNLTTLQVDLATTARLRPMIPAGRLVVSESGFSRREQVLELERLGVDAVLIGTALMASADPAATLRALRGI